MASHPSFSLTDPVMQATSRLVDDREATREPSHYDIGQVFQRAKLDGADPHNDPSAAKVGKRKRVQQVLAWAMDNDEAAGVAAVTYLVGVIKGCGGFTPGNPNYCGDEAIATCIGAFDDQSMELTTDGILRPRSLQGLAGRPLTRALRTYVVRAQKGFEDSVLVAGTDKDLIEAAAAHVLVERFGLEELPNNFPTLLGQAFAAVGLDAQRPKQEVGGLPGARTALSCSLYELGCAVNRLRNKAGSGHGRPFVPELGGAEVAAATEAAGLVAGRLLDALES